MSNNVTFQASTLSTAPNGTIVETADQGGGVQRQVFQLGSAGAIAPVSSTALESSHVISAAACSLYGITCTIGATAGWLMLFDATSAPADGAVTPAYFVPAGSNGTFGSVSVAFHYPLKFSTGCVAVFSTTGPFSKTASATAAFVAQKV